MDISILYSILPACLAKYVAVVDPIRYTFRVKFGVSCRIWKNNVECTVVALFTQETP
jgi:hypothetical protein